MRRLWVMGKRSFKAWEAQLDRQRSRGAGTRIRLRELSEAEREAEAALQARLRRIVRRDRQASDSSA